MLEDMEAKEGELSDALSDNEYDEVRLQLLRERDDKDHEEHYDDHAEAEENDVKQDPEQEIDNDRDYDAMERHAESMPVKTEASTNGTATEPKKKYDPKDPLRPRRKKARRACYACQRAHLTCGDERPCQRCIKRGLADGCQDGVRKKAKYLHDAPADALRPVLGPNFNPGASNAASARSNGHRHPSSAGSDVSVSNVGSFYHQSNTAAPFNVFSSGQTPSGTLAENLTFAGPQSPVSPHFVPTSTDGNAHLSRLGLSSASAGVNGFSPALFDPSNPALFNFNLEGINFGSQYAAMEFDILGHMSSGAADDPAEHAASLSQQGAGPGSFAPADVFGGGVNQTLYNGNNTAGGSAGSGLVNDFMGLDAPNNGFYSQGNLQHGLPLAYAIAAAPPSLQSPSTDNNSPQPTGYGFEGSPTMATYAAAAGGGSGVANGNGHMLGGRASLSQLQQAQASHKTKSAMAKLLPQSILGKRHRDPSAIYDMVQDPYTYVTAFHQLIAVLSKRFPSGKTVRIAKALSSIRPSLISCMRTLNRQDLVFMEKCFQRTLFEYEEFMTQVSSPAIVCRRTGEIAAVNKEFTALTGWTKEVLLGQAPNLNVNTGVSATAAAVAAASTTTAALAAGRTEGGTAGSANSGVHGHATPRLRAMNAEAVKASEGKTQPMFLAELMDDDNVIEFYEDFAHLAFNDSRGWVNRKCRLLKYRTREMLDSSSAAGSSGSGASSGSGGDGSGGDGSGGGSGGSNVADDGSNAGSRPSSRPGTATAGPQLLGSAGVAAASRSILSSRVARIDGEHGISKIERDGKLECSYCWHIRRDTFDIPMMIVMNFLPCYYPNQEPHQLAV